MPNLKDIKTRINSVKKTKQITSAMKLVAAAKLRGATERATAAQPYQQRLRAVLGRVAANAGDVEDPLLQTPAKVERVLLVLLTSDRGLCGGFNNNLLRRARDFAEVLSDGKLDGETTRLEDPSFDHLGQFPEVSVAGGQFRPRIADADDGFAIEFVVGNTLDLHPAAMDEGGLRIATKPVLTAQFVAVLCHESYLRFWAPESSGE